MMTSLWIFFSGRISRWTLFDDVRGGGLDGLDQALGRLGDFHRLELSPRPPRHGRRASGTRRVGRAVVPPAGGRHAFRRQAGGEVFRAFNFVHVPLFKQAVGTALFADDVSPGLDRFAVGLLVSGVQAAFGLEPHSAAAPREVVIAHS